MGRRRRRLRPRPAAQAAPLAGQFLRQPEGLGQALAAQAAVFTANGGFTSVAAIGHGFRAAMIAATAVSAAGALTGAGLARRRPDALARLAPEDLPAPASAPSLWR
jgi:hypothetical protein